MTCNTAYNVGITDNLLLVIYLDNDVCAVVPREFRGYNLEILVIYNIAGENTDAGGICTHLCQGVYQVMLI